METKNKGELKNGKLRDAYNNLTISQQQSKEEV